MQFYCRPVPFLGFLTGSSVLGIGPTFSRRVAVLRGRPPGFTITLVNGPGPLGFGGWRYGDFVKIDGFGPKDRGGALFNVVVCALLGIGMIYMGITATPAMFIGAAFFAVMECFFVPTYLRARREG